MCDYFVDLPDKAFKPWKEVVPDFAYDQKTPFFSMLVPTVDTVRYAFIFEHSVDVMKPVLFTGHSGVGKSVVVAKAMQDMVEIGAWGRVDLSFSAQTSAKRTQETIESKLEKKKKTLLGPPPGKRLVMFIDDVNMPALETYGASPPVELLRQFLDYKGFYDRQKLFWKGIADVCAVAACGPPGGGRNSLTPRYVRHHTVVAMTQPSAEAMKRIFLSIVDGSLKLNGIADIMALGKPIVDASVDLFFQVLNDLKPIPAKSHYTFNLRDVSKIVQGVLMMRPTAIPSKETLAKLWAHESLRVFCNRLIDDEDRNYFTGMVADARRCSSRCRGRMRNSSSQSKGWCLEITRRWACPVRIASTRRSRIPQSFRNSSQTILMSTMPRTRKCVWSSFGMRATTSRVSRACCASREATRCLSASAVRASRASLASPPSCQR